MEEKVGDDGVALAGQRELVAAGDREEARR
jgi:hypothetical protein